MSCLVLATAMPYPYAMPDDPYAPPPVYDAPIGRVKIQVSDRPFEHIFDWPKVPDLIPKAYRGPSKPAGGYDSFAPWGFYVTQPKDNFYGYAAYH